MRNTRKAVEDKPVEELTATALVGSLCLNPGSHSREDIPHVGPLASYPFYEWEKLPGAEVEVRLNGALYRHGRIEAATADGKIAWMAKDGLKDRTLIDKASGYEIRLAPPQLQAIHAMTQAGIFKTNKPFG